MHITRIELNHIKGFERLVWEPPTNRLAGWHVVLGDNGMGKSTCLRAVVLAFIGAHSPALQIDYDTFVSLGADQASVDIYLWDVDSSSESERSIAITRGAHTPAWVTVDDGTREEHIYGFCASFGPMRRFTGGDRDLERLYQKLPEVGAHLSLFKEGAALTEVSKWLERLRFEELERGGEHKFLANLRQFINQDDFLPHGTRLTEISSKGVFFTDGRGAKIELDQLSDGFRSVLCLALELTRQLYVKFGEDVFTVGDDAVILNPSGVVLIDEVDAHLHPTWQQRIGSWFVKHFPNIQFIVTTHSPLVCHAAETGTIFKLASPDNPKEQSRFIEGEERKRLIYGNVLDAYGTDAFGHITVSSSARAMREELAALNVSEALDDAILARKLTLERALPTTMTSSADRLLDSLGLDFDALDALPVTSPLDTTHGIAHDEHDPREDANAVATPDDDDDLLFEGGGEDA